ncbi:rhombotarget lipoprotein [Gallaecimonas kandeliae]|nr:rhombotarget lipoprotein [Gallaecimonas kandeliae]WKE67438.1 rhombotarget lipoprotein [Gallaecimonas kandeliae]
MALVALLSGCAGTQSRTQSSVVDYLYPKGNMTVEQTTSIPTLTIPLKVGIAFVPDQTLGGRLWSGALTEAEKSNLLEKVAANFRKYDFVSDIQVIPSAYLTEGGSFANLDQIRTMYGIDVIALVSHDQVQFTDEGLLSLTYWTLVGAYVVSGEKNDTSTMLDTAVYDIPSRKMLFRAPGTSNIKGSSTPVNLSEELRNDRVKGFNDAAVMMTANLDQQLAQFKARIKADPGKVKVVKRAGYAGGAFGGMGVLLMLLFLAASRSRTRYGA